MKNNALYFPFINVPPVPCVTTSLLYWESIKSIVPFEFLENPERLDRGMRDFVREGLVVQTAPESFVGSFPRFEDQFLFLVESLKLADRHPGRGGWAGGQQTSGRGRIHAGKMALAHSAPVHSAKLLSPSISDELRKLGLAMPRDQDDGFFVAVEPTTAFVFMLFLTLCLCSLDEVDAFPLTDRVFGPAGQTMDAARRYVTQDARSSAREVVLAELLPSPAEPLNVKAIVEIREKHGALMSAFRQEVETFVSWVSACPTGAERDAEVRRFKREKQEEIAAIKNRIAERHRGRATSVGLAGLGFATATLSAVQSVELSTFGVLAAGGAIAYAARCALKDLNEGSEELGRPMAYAAQLQLSFRHLS